MKNVLYILMFFSFLSCNDKKGSINKPEKIVNTKNSVEDKIVSKKTEFTKRDTLISIGKKFEVNNIECYWKFTLMIYEGSEGGTGIIEIINNKTQKVILINEDYYDLTDFNNFKKKDFNLNGEFKDVNFDELKDFTIYCRECSGSGGTFTKVYLFDIKKKKFELSKEVSGGEFEINTTDKTVSTYWKMGVPWNSSKVLHFGKNGKIKFTEITTREVIQLNERDFLVTKYEKIKRKKNVKTKIDTTHFEGY